MSATITSTPLAYNNGAPIAGTTQIGDLAIGTTYQEYTLSPGETAWWMSPDQSLSYIIGVPVSGNTQPTELINPPFFGYLTYSNVYIGNDISISNNGQTATQQFGYQQTVLGNTKLGPTKTMFSVLVNLSAPGTLPDSHYIGIGTTNMNYKSSPPYGAYPGNDNQSMGYCSNGTIVYNGTVNLGGLSTWTDNDVIDIVINNEINAMWVRVNGGFWNNNDGADPVTNAGGLEIINNPFYPALCPGYEGTMTIQNTAEYGLPSGYTLLGSNQTASVGFFKTQSLVDSDFINLAQYVSILYDNPQTFSAATEASSWLTTNGFWNTYGNWNYADVYNDAPNDGEITFPNHSNGTGDTNPNNVGQYSTGTQLYINLNNSAGSSNEVNFNQLPGNYGNLTLTQGSNSVTYSFTNQAFEIDYGELISDYFYGNAVRGSLCVTSFSSGDFNTNQTINISQEIYPSSYSFTIDSSMLDSLFTAGAAQYGSPNGTAGFTVSAQTNNLYGGVYGFLNNITSINNAFIAAGAGESYSGVMALVQWGAGSDYQSGLAKISFVSGNNQFFVTSVDGLDSNFTQQYNNAGSNLVGTFNFPATFTIITPLIHKSDWC